MVLHGSYSNNYSSFPTQLGQKKEEKEVVFFLVLCTAYGQNTTVKKPHESQKERVPDTLPEWNSPLQTRAHTPTFEWLIRDWEITRTALPLSGPFWKAAWHDKWPAT